MPQSFEESLFNVVIFDSFDKAGDNGEFLYRRIAQDYPNIKATFILSNKSKDWARLKAEGFNIYPFEGKYVGFIIKNATFVLFSKDVPDTNIKTFLMNNRYKTIFMGHGVTSTIYDDSFYISGTISSEAKYMLATSNGEYKVLTRYSKGKLTPIILGFPRHDTLLEKNTLRSSVEHKKQVFISFHWRRGGGTSRYFNDINNFLASEKLKQLHDSGVSIVFLPHAKFLNKLSQFKIPSWVKIPQIDTFQDILVESDVLVTDFSSNSFEMAYMDKPSVIYIPGANDLNASLNHYHLEHLDYVHMSYCKTKEQALSKI